MNKVKFLTVALLFTIFSSNNVQAETATPLSLNMFLSICSKDMPPGDTKGVCSLMIFSALDAATNGHLVLGENENDLYYDHDKAAKLTYGRKSELLYEYIDLLRERDRKGIIKLDMDYFGLGTATTMMLRDYFPKGIPTVKQKEKQEKKHSFELGNFAIDKPSFSGPFGSKSIEGGELKPIVRISPKHPSKARRDGVSGWVELSFDINTNGEVVNVAVIKSEPERVFDREAKKALKKWKYAPQQEVKTNNKVTIPFEL